MNAYAKSSKIAVALVAFLAVFSTAAVIFADDSDADAAFINSATASDFYENKDGTLTIPIELGADRTVQIIITENGNNVANRTINNVSASATSVNISFSLSEGHHILDITVITKDGGTTISTTPGQYELDVKNDIWSNVGTYVALVVVAIIVIIIVVVYMRAKPNNKPTTTFTQLEEEKKAAAASAPEKEKSAPKTEKIKYTSSRRK